ncbi:MAG: prolyl oligopeptidase family serine peptidase [Candidatus Marinimicrobia bacterium]|nr:prolyl oligopeptidase family serine peptidase [Candidatus Neomarinimicrobiota bacterium]
MIRLCYSICSAFAVLTFFSFAAAQEPPELPEGYVMQRDLVYHQTDSRDLKLDIYYSRESPEPLPLVILVHGGAWRAGSKDGVGLNSGLINKGYAVAAINYRLSQEAIFPAQIIDCKVALRYLRAHAKEFNINPRRFGAMGWSAGGHLVALLGTAEDHPDWEQGDHLEYSSRVQAVADFYGPTDFLRMNDIEGTIDHDAPDSPESQLIGGPIQENKKKVRAANPITYAAPYNPPFLILHGKEDRTVPPNQSKLLHQALQKAGVESRLILIDSAGHGGERFRKYQPKVNAFFDEHLLHSDRDVEPQPDTPGINRRWTHTYFEIPDFVCYKRTHFESISHDYGYLLYLPRSYHREPDRRYPVIYWLPGRGGNPDGALGFMEMYGRAVESGRTPEAIIIGVNGINSSMYTNDKNGTFPIESVIIHDLIPHVDAAYRSIPGKDKRALAGFSMGGFGAARLGFKYQDYFDAVSILGAAMHKPETLRDKRQDIFRTVYDNDLEYCRQQSPWTIVREHAEAIQSIPHIRLLVGEDDMLAAKNRDYHMLMDSLGIQHTYEMITGASHNYRAVLENMTGDPFAFYREAFD